jgi:hypothetical protein
MKNYISKQFAIALLLALAPLSISSANGWSNDNHHHSSQPQPLEGVNKYKYKVGDRGPGGGLIFFVDRYDQYPGFTYLEAAPTDIAPVVWCDKTTTSIPAVAGLAANAVGKGQANTTAMLGVCTSGAANAADSYLTVTKSDWFLPSEGELMLMYTNLLQTGVGVFAYDSMAVGGFPYANYWSSSEFDSNLARFQLFFNGYQYYSTSKGNALPVRAVRAF